MKYLELSIYATLFLSVLTGIFFVYKQLRKETKIQQDYLNHQEESLSLIRQELALVKEELKLNNDEMLYNRMVPVIYNQLKRFEESINLFSFEGLKGGDGINYLMAKINLKQTEVYGTDRHISEKLFESVKAFELKQLIAFDDVAELAFESAKNIQAVRTVLENSNCALSQKVALKTLFLDNISNRYFQFIKKVLEVSRKRISDIPSEKKLALFQKETFIKDRELVKNFKVVIDFKKNHSFNS